MERPDPLAEPEGYGVKPGQEDASLPETQCQMHSTADVRCTRDATWLVTTGCLGEHVYPFAYCDPCYFEVTRANRFCTICRAARAADDSVHILKAEHVGSGDDSWYLRTQAQLDEMFKGEDHGA